MRIICVDDDGLVRSITADLLRALGHDVAEAESASEVIGHLQAGRADLLVTDIRMPGGVSGGELARQAKAVQPALPVIYFTGYDDAPPDAEAYVLRKPCSLGTLAQAIERVTA